MSYEKNGNIMNLSRYGDRDEQYLPIQIDNLGYTYATNSNKLLNVADTSNNTSGFNDFNKTGDDYVYDGNGNMTVDKNKKITTITYNHLNLPTKIIFPTGNIVYFYNASGQKVQKVVTENTTVTTTDYLGGYQYKNAVLQFLPTVEGYVKNTPVSGINTYSYVFNYTDHLGNTRLSYTKDTATGSLKIVEENNYYPFGLKHNSYNVDNFQPGYKYKYNGKELQDELGLNMTAMDYRQYDNTLGRFNSIDLISEKDFSTSPYVFARNNPVFWADPSGLEADIYQMMRAMWNNTPAGTNSTWTNDGTGNFDNSNGTSVVNRDGEYYKTPAESLPQVTIYKGIGDKRNGDIIRGHVYWNSKYYKGWRNKQRVNQWSDFGQGLQNTGDIISGVGYVLTTSVVFAEIGIPLATLGNAISLGGTMLSTSSTTVELINGNDVSKNKFKIAKAVGVVVASEILKKYINKVPGLEPTIKDVDGDEIMNLSNEILQQNVSLKIMGIDRYIDTKIDNE
jgi:RHS repeat-associated protein